MEIISNISNLLILDHGQFQLNDALFLDLSQQIMDYNFLHYPRSKRMELAKEHLKQVQTLYAKNNCINKDLFEQNLSLALPPGLSFCSRLRLQMRVLLA